MGGLEDGGRCAMRVKNRDYRLSRVRSFGGTHVPHRDHSKIFPASTLLGVHSASFGGDEKTGFWRRGKTESISDLVTKTDCQS